MKRSPMPPRRTAMRRSAPLRTSGDPLWASAPPRRRSAGDGKRQAPPLSSVPKPIPKTITAAVMERDEWCRAQLVFPGTPCSGKHDPHHVWRRGTGGPDEVWNLVRLCRAHHDLVHSLGVKRCLGFIVQAGDAEGARRLCEGTTQG